MTKQHFLAGLLASTAIAISPLALVAQSPAPPSYRSVNDEMVRPIDELDRPRNEERQTHRGYEVRKPQFTVISMTGREDARLAAAEVSKAWEFTNQLADQWMTKHRRGDFGIGALQVVIDDEPIRDRDQPATTVDVVGLVTQVHVRVGENLPTLDQQLAAMREGVAFAILHTAECDRTFPTWVVEGLSTYIAVKTGEPTADEPIPMALQIKRPAQPGGLQWRAKRETQDTLEPDTTDRLQAALMVQFLLEGNDAHHAWEFFTALAQADRSAVRGDDQLPDVAITEQERFIGQRNVELEALPEQVAAEFDAWKNDPLARQPIYLPREDASPEQLEREAEMLTILKLARRAPTTVERRVRTKIVEFRKESAPAVSSDAAAGPRSIAALEEQLTDESRAPWATVLANGRLLLSSDTRAIDELLGVDENRFEVLSEEGAWKIATRLEDGRYLVGYLADSRETPSRPLARFEVRKTKAKPAAAPVIEKIEDAEVGNLPLGADRLLPTFRQR